MQRKRISCKDRTSVFLKINTRKPETKPWLTKHLFNKFWQLNYSLQINFNAILGTSYRACLRPGTIRYVSSSSAYLRSFNTSNTSLHLGCIKDLLANKSSNSLSLHFRVGVRKSYACRYLTCSLSVLTGSYISGIDLIWPRIYSMKRVVLHILIKN